MQIGDVPEHTARRDRIRMPVLAENLSDRGVIEKSVHRRDALFARDANGIARGIDAKEFHSERDVTLEKSSVV